MRSVSQTIYWNIGIQLVLFCNTAHICNTEHKDYRNVGLTSFLMAINLRFNPGIYLKKWLATKNAPMMICKSSRAHLSSSAVIFNASPRQLRENWEYWIDDRMHFTFKDH